MTAREENPWPPTGINLSAYKDLAVAADIREPLLGLWHIYLTKGNVFPVVADYMTYNLYALTPRLTECSFFYKGNQISTGANHGTLLSRMNERPSLNFLLHP